LLGTVSGVVVTISQVEFHFGDARDSSESISVLPLMFDDEAAAMLHPGRRALRSLLVQAIEDQATWFKNIGHSKLELPHIEIHQFCAAHPPKNIVLVRLKRSLIENTMFSPQTR
jgi:hypothetical protein